MVTHAPSDGCFNYTNEICLSSLQSAARDHGINVTGNSIMVQYNKDVGNVNPVDTFDNLASEECRRVGLPLLCQYIYPICNPHDGSVVFTNTREQCIYVTEGACQKEFVLAQSLFPTFNIPNCNDFNSNNHSSSAQMVNTTNSTETNTTAKNNSSCHPQFERRCGQCIPICNKFSETSEERQKLLDAFFIIAALICVIGGTLVIIVSIMRRDVM